MYACDRVHGEMAELVEGAPLLREYTGLNLYRGFESLSLRHQPRVTGNRIDSTEWMPVTGSVQIHPP